MNSVVYKPRAKEDVRKAFDWYEEKREGLGLEFLESLEETIARFQDNPLLCFLRG